MNHELIWRSRPDTFAEHMTRDRDVHDRFELFDHLALVGRAIARAVMAGRGRLIISMPPQHGKSTLLSRWTPLWFLEHWPHLRVIAASYSDELIRGHSRFVRDQFNSSPDLHTKLRHDSQAANRWNTAEGGGMLATTIGGQLSGFGGDLILIDDPYKGWKEAWSAAVRRDVQRWFESDLYTRRQRNTTIIVLHTRWHPDDLTGYLLKKHTDDWTLIRLPALAEEDDPLGRDAGEALCPKLQPRDELLAGRSSEAIFRAVYQQDPLGLGDSQVYNRFSEQRNVDEDVDLSDGYPLHMSWDFNVRPGMHVELGQYLPDQDVLTCVHELHGPGWDVRAAMQAFERWWDEHDGDERWPEVWVFGDSAGRARQHNTSQSSYDLIGKMFRRMGVNYRIRVPKKAPSLKDSVDDFNEALSDVDDAVHYLVHPRCDRLIADFRELPPDENGGPDKSDPDLSHASDAERYRVTRLRPLSRRKIGMGRVQAG